MGVIGQAVGGFGGAVIGKKIGKYFNAEGAGETAGSIIGNYAGMLSPYEKGGVVRGKKGKPVVILAHAGEFVLPIGVKPSIAQKKKIAKMKK